MIGFFKAWLGRPDDEQTASLNATALVTGKAEELPLVGPVTQVLTVHFDGVREIRSVFKCGDAFFLWTIDDPARVKRVLPYGRFAEGGPSTHIKTWEPFSDPDWQPDGAETACEKVRRLVAENEELGAALDQARKSLARIRNMAAEAFE